MQNKTSQRRMRPISALVTLTAAAVVLTSTVTASSANSRHARSGQPQQLKHSWLDANASAQTGGRSFSGVASHYGLEAGNKTASGQRMNPHAMTAAHRTLPFGTKLRVTHRNRSVVVTINDRGPFIRGRVLDLSNGAARAIGLNGLGRVVAEVQ